MSLEAAYDGPHEPRAKRSDKIGAKVYECVRCGELASFPSDLSAVCEVRE